MKELEDIFDTKEFKSLFLGEREYGLVLKVAFIQIISMH
jgi:hypothetical protein